MSKHVTIEELLKQIADNTAAIKQESAARDGADEAIASHIGAMSTNLPRSIQSQDYVPGVSGWKLDQLSGDFEINSCTIGSASKAPERQVVSVEVASYSKWDLPKNAANLLQFMEAELHKVPEEYRHAAEFEEFDASYGDESFNSRLFLSYSRLETEEELVDRIERAKVAGTKVTLASGLLTITHDGIPRVRIGNMNKDVQDVQVAPFVVCEDQVFVDQAFIKAASIVDAKLAPMWSVKMELRNGKYVAAGIGLGLGSQFLTGADRFAIKEPTEFEKALAAGDVTKVLDLLAGKIADTQLGEDLKAGRCTPIADQVREVIRAEIQPGGLLHRCK